MSVLKEIINEIPIHSIYDFQSLDFSSPYQGMLEITVDRKASERCAHEVFKDIGEKICFSDKTLSIYGKFFRDMLVTSLQIVLSNEEPPHRHYGNIPFRGISSKIGDYENDPRLSDYDRETLEDIKRRMREDHYYPYENEHRDMSPLLRKIITDLNRDWRNRSFTSKTIAEFRKPYTIVIYMKTVADYYDKNNLSSIEPVFSGTLAHELFHWYHYARVFHKKTWGHYNATEWVPVESLASFYEYTCYYDEKLVRNQSDLMCSWRDHDMDAWPYAGAKYLLDNSNQSADDRVRYGGYLRFNRVYEDSLVGMKYAYEDLVVFRKKEEDPDFFELV